MFFFLPLLVSLFSSLCGAFNLLLDFFWRFGFFWCGLPLLGNLLCRFLSLWDFFVVFGLFLVGLNGEKGNSGWLDWEMRWFEELDIGW
jgi:hypothetical protein